MTKILRGYHFQPGILMKLTFLFYLMSAITMPHSGPVIDGVNQANYMNNNTLYAD